MSKPDIDASSTSGVVSSASSAGALQSSTIANQQQGFHARVASLRKNIRELVQWKEDDESVDTAEVTDLSAAQQSAPPTTTAHQITEPLTFTSMKDDQSKPEAADPLLACTVTTATSTGRDSSDDASSSIDFGSSMSSPLMNIYERPTNDAVEREARRAKIKTESKLLTIEGMTKNIETKLTELGADNEGAHRETHQSLRLESAKASDRHEDVVEGQAKTNNLVQKSRVENAFVGRHLLEGQADQGAILQELSAGMKAIQTQMKENQEKKEKGKLVNKAKSAVECFRGNGGN